MAQTVRRHAPKVQRLRVHGAARRRLLGRPPADDLITAVAVEQAVDPARRILAPVPIDNGHLGIIDGAANRVMDGRAIKIQVGAGRGVAHGAPLIGGAGAKAFDTHVAGVAFAIFGLGGGGEAGQTEGEGDDDQLGGGDAGPLGHVSVLPWSVVDL